MVDTKFQDYPHRILYDDQRFFSNPALVARFGFVGEQHLFPVQYRSIGAYNSKLLRERDLNKLSGNISKKVFVNGNIATIPNIKKYELYKKISNKLFFCCLYA